MGLETGGHELLDEKPSRHAAAGYDFHV